VLIEHLVDAGHPLRQLSWSPLAGRFRHCLNASNTRSTPVTIVMTEAAGGEPPERRVGNRSASSVKPSAAPATPTTQPTSRPTVLLFAFGDNSMKTVVMIVVTAMAMATASGGSSPIAVPMRLRHFSDDPESGSLATGPAPVAGGCHPLLIALVAWSPWATARVVVAAPWSSTPRRRLTSRPTPALNGLVITEH
jgi:hypothetical protein